MAIGIGRFADDANLAARWSDEAVHDNGDFRLLHVFLEPALDVLGQLRRCFAVGDDVRDERQRDPAIWRHHRGRAELWITENVDAHRVARTDNVRQVWRDDLIDRLIGRACRQHARQNWKQGQSPK